MAGAVDICSLGAPEPAGRVIPARSRVRHPRFRRRHGPARAYRPGRINNDEGQPYKDPRNGLDRLCCHAVAVLWLLPVQFGRFWCISIELASTGQVIGNKRNAFLLLDLLEPAYWT